MGRLATVAETGIYANCNFLVGSDAESLSGSSRSNEGDLVVIP
jgi:hypothetical protein